MIASEIAKKYIEKCKEKYQREMGLSNIEKEIKSLDSQLEEQMENEDLQEFVVDDLKFERKIDESFSLTGDATGEKWDAETGHFFQWLKEIGEKALIKTKGSVHAGTRKKFLKDRREEGLNLPEFIKVGFWKHVKTNQSEIERRALNG